ncbi:MAG: hypothetical protein HC929_10710 [Leptolyngbyaceae cyanobacterium SM2_5_2]|nr:hypothetical protein [Leptolyngbyaceae cyanobacterium SM2_5_2]
MFQTPISGAPASTESFSSTPQREEVRHLLIGPPKAVERTIRILHVMGYADPNDWSRPIPLGEGGKPCQRTSRMALDIIWAWRSTMLTTPTAACSREW